MQFEVKITIFTPTYNRGYILENLYMSLRRQTYTNFEWIIIDDGSIDNTELLVKEWITKNNKFKIIYKKTINKGKHCAINTGVKMANGELFFIVDSDDYLADNALERIVYWQSTIMSRPDFAGICGNRCYFNKKLIGTTFNGVYIDCRTIDREHYGITGDKAEVFYTNILRKYPFPEFKGEKFCSEALVWDRISKDGYKIRYFNESIYFTEYRDDGLTKNIMEKYKNSPKGTMLFFKERTINHKKSIVHFLKYGSFYYLYGFKFGYDISTLKKELKINFWRSELLKICAVIRKYIKHQ